MLTNEDVRCEWGPQGIDALAGCRTFIVVDVLSFSTCVSVAAARDVVIVPHRSRDSGAVEVARRHGGVLAGARGSEYSLSPASVVEAPRGLCLVLPSPNGAAASLDAAGRGHVLAGCLRNASAVSALATVLGGPFGIVPAGERWADGTLRFALEDLVGAGAIAAGLAGRPSPEAAAAMAAYRSAAPRLLDTLASCVSGRELVARGFADDVRLASGLDADTVAPMLVDGRFVGQPP